MSDRDRLIALYTSIPESSEQSVRRDRLIHELEVKLGIREPDVSALVEHGDLSDVN